MLLKVLPFHSFNSYPSTLIRYPTTLTAYHF
uniref:Uncharacterized protein n=1 Tax=Myoviridae sp. ct6F13 TaxID=2827602 RepID=A0A8S5LJ78_9CAUD|nr:MAG TPA: hypothetical protein [Myoviridae sp. ct6F13]